jgi:hypothetical protein
VAEAADDVEGPAPAADAAPRHRARAVSSQIRNPLAPWGRVVAVLLELWAVIVVAGSAGAIASFFQTADR